MDWEKIIFNTIIVLTAVATIAGLFGAFDHLTRGNIETFFLYLLFSFVFCIMLVIQIQEKNYCSDLKRRRLEEEGKNKDVKRPKYLE